MARGWALALAGFLLLVPTALAAQGSMSGRAELPLQIEGTHDAKGSDARFLLEGDGGQASFLLQGADGQALRVIHRAWGYVNSQNPKAGVLWDDSTETQPLALSGALVSLDERRPDFRFLAFDGSPVLSNGPADSPLLVGALTEAKTVAYSLNQTVTVHLGLPPMDSSQVFSQVIPAGTFQARSDDGRAHADGAFQLFISDATLTYRGPAAVQSIPAYFRVENRPGTIYNPATKTWSGPLTHPEYIQEYLMVDAKDARFDLQYSGIAGSLFTPRAAIDIDGHALLPKMDGTVTVTDDGKATRYDLHGDDLDLAGRYTLQVHDVLSNPARTQVEGDGDITGVTYASTAAHYDWIPVATAGVSALLLVAAAWVLANAKTVGSVGGLLAGYARVSGQEVLEHPGRSEVYERVKAAPGINFVQLAEQVNFGSSTLNYHLRVLERNEYITSVKDGRYLRFFDRTAGTYSGAKKNQVSALRNATTAAMARHIKEHPGVAQCDLATAFGVTASTVNWHMTRLQSAGLVERQRDAHYTRYYLSQGWSQLPASEMERLGTAPPAPMLVAPIAV